jgi:hypothetical protein
MGKIIVENVRKIGDHELQLIIKTPTCYSARWFTINVSLLGGHFVVDVLPEGKFEKGRSVKFPKR